MPARPRFIARRSAHCSSHSVLRRVTQLGAYLRESCSHTLAPRVLAAALVALSTLVSARGLIAQQQPPSALVAGSKTSQAHKTALPMITGTNGAQTGTASFMGNFTTITTLSGAALACLLFFGIPARRRRWRSMLSRVPHSTRVFCA